MVMIPLVTSGSSQVTVIAVELISLTNKSPGMPGTIEQLPYLCYKSTVQPVIYMESYFREPVKNSRDRNVNRRKIREARYGAYNDYVRMRV